MFPVLPVIVGDQITYQLRDLEKSSEKSLSLTQLSPVDFSCTISLRFVSFVLALYAFCLGKGANDVQPSLKGCEPRAIQKPTLTIYEFVMEA